VIPVSRKSQNAWGETKEMAIQTLSRAESSFQFFQFDTLPFSFYT